MFRHFDYLKSLLSRSEKQNQRSTPRPVDLVPPEGSRRPCTRGSNRHRLFPLRGRAFSGFDLIYFVLTPCRPVCSRLLKEGWLENRAASKSTLSGCGQTDWRSLFRTKQMDTQSARREPRHDAITGMCGRRLLGNELCSCCEHLAFISASSTVLVVRMLDRSFRKPASELGVRHAQTAGCQPAALPSLEFMPF